MISGRWTEFFVAGKALLILLSAASIVTNVTLAASTPEQVESIISNINTPRDTPIPFVEHRTSQLLTEPLMLSGEIEFTTDGTLSKWIGEPFDEHIIISAQHVELRRKNKTRRLSLDQRPDIKAFYVGMQALLAADASALFESFDITAAESTDGWSLALTPREKKLSKFVARLTISGKETQVQMVRTEQPGGDWQEMLFHITAD
jgi:hypothetical protein